MATTFAELVARVKGHEARLERAEEDMTAIITTVADTQRRVARLELAMGRLLGHLGLTMPTDAEVDAALEDEDLPE